MWRWQGTFTVGQEFFVEFLAGPQSGELDSDLIFMKTRQADHQAPKHFVWNRSLQRIAVIGGLAVLIILGVMKLFIPSEIPLIGTADASQTWSPLLILAGIIVIVFLLWHNRHN